MIKFKKSTKRFIFLIFILCFSSLFGFYFISFFKKNIEFYIETDQIDNIKNKNQIFRVGGIVKHNSIKILEDKKQIHFIILDQNNLNPLYVINSGLSCPPIFKEGSGIIVKGRLDSKSKIFYSFEMIGKHDENYMPKNVKVKK